jgi:beta-galactosidase
VGVAADFERDRGAYLSIGDGKQAGLDIRGSLTLVGWMRPEVLDQWQVLAGKYGFVGVNDRAYRIDLRPGGTVGFIVSPDGGFDSGYLLDAVPPVALSAGTWYHVAGVFDAQARTMTVYLDGKVIGARSVSHSIIHDAAAPFILGADVKSGVADQHFDGQLDDWRVYGRALAAGEIEALMAPPPAP